MRALFFGTPALAVPCLDAVAEIADVVQVVAQPDRPSGRGMKTRPVPVKARALELGLPVIQPTKVRTAEFAESLRALEADVAVVIAYGRILPTAVLEAPRRGCVNVHASLLPRWRGAGPIQWSIAHGDAETGVTLMRMDEGMDTGPILAMERLEIGPDETAGQLGPRLAALGADMLRAHLTEWVEGSIEPRPQPEEGATHAPLLTKEDGRIDWSALAPAVHDRVRAMSPWPGAFTRYNGEVLKVHRTERCRDDGVRGPAGTVLVADPDHLEVACGEGSVRLLSLQRPGRKRLEPEAFLAGERWTPGLLLGS